MKFVFNDGGLAASKHDEVNDCTCRAIAIATERPYHEIWSMFQTLLAKESSRPRSGVSEKVTNQLMESLGWTWMRVHKRAELREDDLPSGRLVVSIHAHSVAVINGVIHDTWDCSLNKYGKPPQVFGYYKKGQSQTYEQGINADQKKVLDAVAKILALAESTDYEAEALTARAKAAELIARYNITVDSLKDLSGFVGKTEFRTGTLPSYEFSLLAHLGRFCGVLVLSAPRQHGGRNFEFFGKSHDLEGFYYMRDVVFSQLERAWAEYLEANPSCSRDKVWWGNGFAKGVEVKIKELMRAAEVQQKALRQDLVLVPRAEQSLKEWECLFGKLGSGGSAYGGGTSVDGFAAGRSVSLSKGVRTGGGGSVRAISGPR